MAFHGEPEEPQSVSGRFPAMLPPVSCTYSIFLRTTATAFLFNEGLGNVGRFSKFRKQDTKVCLLCNLQHACVNVTELPTVESPATHKNLHGQTIDRGQFCR